MRLALDPRARRLLRRVPRSTVYTGMELILLSLLAVQCARLVWTIATPVGPIGEWRTSASLRTAAPVSSGALTGFDPFFRLSGAAGPATVTILNLKLFGVREDRASGRGAAIIATADGRQRSFAVGEEIMPGVTLTGVGFDNVTLTRNGATEQLFLDQSGPPPTIATSASAAPVSSTSVAPPPLTQTPLIQTMPPPPSVAAPPPNARQAEVNAQ